MNLILDGESNVTLGSRGYFFLVETDGSRRSRVNEALFFFGANAASVF